MTLSFDSQFQGLPLAPQLPDNERPRFMLVYQAGIANLFQVDCHNLALDGRNARRIYQGDFRTAESMARGCGHAGAVVMTAACNQAGDIADSKWSEDLENQPFSDKFQPVFYTIGF
jgi:hypothetical protein